jgi:cytochrome c biogenesis protein CcdA
MATVHRLPTHEAPAPETLLSRLARLLKLEMELGIAEVRETLIAAAIAAAVAMVSAIALIASIVVLLAGAFAPLFRTPWQHFIIAGGGVFLLATAAIAWSVWRLKNLQWPKQTLTSFEENFRWLGAQVKSRLILP